MTVFTEANDSVSSCHTYYNYDNNINYQANLNLQAYVIDYDGVIVSSIFIESWAVEE